jgi:hypothetical protein
MQLNEFFGKGISLGKKDRHIVEKQEIDHDGLFWYIVDHDKLHKDHLMPLVDKIKSQNEKGKLDREELLKDFMPMVKKGCLEYFHHSKMSGDPKEIFSKEMRGELCEKLYDHYVQDIIEGEYDI